MWLLFFPVARFVPMIAGKMAWNLSPLLRLDLWKHRIKSTHLLYILIVRKTEIIFAVLLFLIWEARVEEESPSQAWVYVKQKRK